MTEEQKKLKAERDRRYREKKKAEKAAEKDLQAPKETKMILCSAEAVQGLEQCYAEADLQSPCIPLTESAMQAPDSELLERYRKELQPEPVLEEPLTYFDVYKRRHEGMFK